MLDLFNYPRYNKHWIYLIVIFLFQFSHINNIHNIIIVLIKYFIDIYQKVCLTFFKFVLIKFFFLLKRYNGYNKYCSN